MADEIARANVGAHATAPGVAASLMRVLRRTLLAIAVLLAVLALVLLRPLDPVTYRSHPNPASTLQEAELRIAQLQATESRTLRSECVTRYLTHGIRTERAVVLVHGYTSCPAQFLRLGELLHAEGHNVLIAPMPLHGNPDRMTETHAELTAQQLTGYADDVVDIARGLGDDVVVAGLSAGGLVAAWAGQHRADVHMAVLISPVLGYEAVPAPLTLAAARLFSVLPNRFQWWDREAQEAAPPDYGYPRYSHRALAQLLFLSAAVMQEAAEFGPATGKIVIVTNANDEMISARRIEMLESHWERATRARIATFEFGAELGLGHDLIDPNMPDQKTELVYARLLELMR